MSTLNNFVEKIKRISIELLEKLKIFIQTTTGRRVLIGMAAISTITIVIAAIFTGDSSKDKDSRVEAVAQATTTEVANEEITEAETTTQTLETTIVEETTEEETTAIEVIDVGNLDISNEDLSTREELNRNNVDTQEQEINYVQLSYDSVTSPSSISKNSHLVYGIDVSKWQGDIDWAKVKAAGYDFAMIRCGGRSIASYASLYIDERFKENVEGALANGIQVGVYFFSQALSEREAQEEASLVLQLIKDYQITYPVAFDWETAAGYRTYNANISTSKFTNIVDTFCTMIQQAGYEPMVYGNYGDLYRFDVETLSKKYKIWYARWYSRYEYTSAKYVEGESVPNLNFSYQMWQYKSTGRVPGISENVDMNVAFIPYPVEDTSNDTLELSIKNKEITINTGEKINLLDGVTAKYISGADASAAVTYEIKNSDGTSINDDIAFDTPGTYTITYVVKDSAGKSVTDSSILTVRSKPTITLTKNEIVYFNTTDFSEKSANDLAIEVQELIENNIFQSVDNEGNDLKEEVEIIYPEILYYEDNTGSRLMSTEDLTDAVLCPGEYLITYKVTDKKGLANSVTLTLKIIDLASLMLEADLNKVNAEDCENNINSILKSNMPIPADAIEIAYSDEFTASIENRSFVVGDEYEVIYYITGLDESIYYKKCSIKIVENEEETTMETCIDN